MRHGCPHWLRTHSEAVASTPAWLALLVHWASVGRPLAWRGSVAAALQALLTQTLKDESFALQ
eukprot:12912193-Alexandrium_andersonii.AAC.1